MYITRPVHHEPELTIIQSEIVTRVSQTLDNSRVHGSESVGHIIPIREPEEIEGRVVLLEIALIEDEEFGE